jgi:hypothetical protein
MRLLSAGCWSLALIVLLLSGCGGGGSATVAGGDGAAAGQPCIVLSNFRIKRQGPKSTIQVDYRFAQGQPNPATKYHWIVEEGHGVSSFVSFVCEPVQLNPSGGTLTTEAGIGTGPHQVATVIAVGPRTTATSDPEPEHVSGVLYEGQPESSAQRLSPEQEATPATFAQTAVLSNPRREAGADGQQIAVEYKIDKLPPAGRFFLAFHGAEGGTMSMEVSDEVRAAASGTFRKASPESPDIVAPLEIQLLAEPFGSGDGPPRDTSVISNTLKIE